ncbi:hypothetical protein KBD59_01670 [Candidatus Gracilibacteria bacterium]|nr:hypothetical protein [Candidatus Gracilibacteria bacterium]
MKSFSIVRIVSAVVVSTLLAAPSALAVSPSFEPAMPIVPVIQIQPLSCNVQASIKYVKVGQNQVTYKVNYNSIAAKADADFVISATTIGGNVAAVRTDLIVQKKGGVDIVAGKGSFAPDNKAEQTFIFNTNGVNSVRMDATVMGTKCTSTTLKPIFIAPPTSGAVFIPSPVITPINIDLSNVPSCQVRAEGTINAQGQIVIGTGIDYQKFTKGSYAYKVEGFVNGSNIPLASYNGTANIVGPDGLFLNPNGGGFMFNFGTPKAGDKLVLTSKLGNATCKTVTYTKPADPAAPPSVNVEGGAANGGNGGSQTPVAVDGSVAGTPSDVATGSGDVVAPDATTTDADQPGTVTPATGATTEDLSGDDDGDADGENDWTDYLLYGGLAAVALGAAGYGTYRASRPS